MRRRLASGLAGLFVTAAAATAVVLGTAGAASAHDFLVSTDPAADSTVSEPLSTVSLVFNEPPLAELGAGIAIEVRDADGTNVASGDVSIVNSTLSIAVAPSSQGAYTVLWQTVSSDGHAVSGEYAFTYAGPVAQASAVPEATPTPTQTGAPDDSTAVATAPPAATATPDATDASEGASAAPSPAIFVGIAAAAVVVIAAVVLGVLLSRRGRRSA
ncbi:copper resistance protein CopC [Herbiconiux sp.]|uniref:copper resistance CopC family protein n=1 Tax=Herbiconiux sp. TaxID=1871186 RepID=UPI0025B9ECF0|nr:copper resistance protein CopC [Herbiconiux sp.]